MAASSRFVPAALASLSIIAIAALWQQWPRAAQRNDASSFAQRAEIAQPVEVANPDRLSPQAQAAYEARLKAKSAAQGG
jgi:hypothetical protein